MFLNDVDGMYKDLEKYCKEREFVNSLKALPFAAQVHSKNPPRRGSGLPYIVHPLFVANYLRLQGIHNDEAIATGLLHDTVEENDNDATLLNVLDVLDSIKYRVNLLTFQRDLLLDKRTSQISWMNQIVHEGDSLTNLVRDIDRFHNLSTMPKAFKKEKMLDYLDETRILFYPNFPIQQERFSKYANLFQILEYSIRSLVDLAEHEFPSKYEEGQLLQRTRIANNKKAHFM